MNLKLGFSLIAFVIAFVVVYFSPVQLGYVDTAIGLIAVIAGKIGVTNWRIQYDTAVNYFKSKTIWGSLIVAVPILILILLPAFGLEIPQLFYQVLMWIISGGGALTLYGIFDAVKK